MAKTTIPIELSSTPSIVDGGNATAITIDSSENVTFAGGLVIPSTITHAGDTDTKLDFNQANTLRLITGDNTAWICSASSMVINEDSIDFDFRVESNNNSSMLFVDGGNDRVGIGDSPRGGQLDVKSQLNMTNSGNVSLTGLKATTFGYSSSYKVLQLGDSASSTAANVAIGVDLSGNASGAFSGSGERVYFRNGINLATPNSSNNGFHNYLQLNDGQINATVPIAIGGTAAANALDDYEEGSWTPAIGGVSSNPTISYSQQTGKYIKIGRMVKLFGRIRPSSVSGGSGGVQITGLPFTAHDDSDETGGSVGLALGFTAVPTTLQVDGGNQVIYILSSPNNTLVTDFDFSYLYFQIDYLT